MCTRSARWFYGDNEDNVASLSVVKHNPTSTMAAGKMKSVWKVGKERGRGGGGGSQKNCAEIGVKDKK